jgi:hypothetical protein
MATLQDLTNAVFGKYNIGTLSAAGLQTNLTGVCSTIAAGVLTWVNEDCVILVNNLSVPMLPGAIVRLSAFTQPDGIGLASTSTDDYLCGVVYRGNTYQQPVVVAIQGEYPVKINNALLSLPTVGNLVTLSTTQGEGSILASQVTGINCIGVCSETYAILPSNRMVKCMIQNFQSI